MILRLSAFKNYIHEKTKLIIFKIFDLSAEILFNLPIQNYLTAFSNHIIAMSLSPKSRLKRTALMDIRNFLEES